MLKNQLSATAAPSAPVSKLPVKAESAGDTRRIQVRRSGVHGKGVYALQDLAEGEMLIEYGGVVISW